MSTLGSLVVDVSANVARFQGDMGKVAHIAETAMARVEQTSTLAASALKSVGIAVGAAFALGALRSFADNVIASTASLKDLAEKTGSSVENLSALRSVASLGGRDIDSIANAMVKLTKGLNGADEETKGAAQGIQALGLNLKEFQKLDAAQQIKAIADKMIGFADDTGKTAIALNLFGKAGADALPFLKDLAETGDLVAKITAAQAEEADKYEKNLRAISTSADKLKKDFVLGLLPALADITSAMRIAAKESGILTALWVGLGGLFAKSTIGQFFNADGAADGIKEAKRQAEELKHLGNVIEYNQALADKGDLRAGILVARARERLEILSKQALATTDALKKSVNEPFKEAEKPSLKGAITPTTAARVNTAGDSFIEQLKRQVEQQTRGKFEMLRLEAAQKGVSGAANKYIFQLEEIESRNERIKRTVEETAKAEEQRAKVTGFVTTGNDASKAIIDQTEALGMNGIALVKLTEMRKIDAAIQLASVNATSETRQELELLAEVMRVNVIDAIDAADKKQKELNASWKVGANEALRKYGEQALDTAGQVENALTNAFKGAEDALVNFVQTGKLDFKSLANSIIADIIRIQVRSLISNAASGPSGGGWAGVLGTIGSMFSGSYDSNYSHEGIHAANGLAYVPYDGMRATLHEGERVMTKQENAGGGGSGAVFTFNYGDTNVGQGVSRGEVSAAVKGQAAETEARIRRLMRNGNM